MIPTEAVWVQCSRCDPEPEPHNYNPNPTHQISPKPVRLVPIKDYYKGMKFEYYVNFMSWWNTQQKRWYRIPPGFYPDKWHWSCVGLRRTREAYMYATTKCWEIWGGEGEPPSVDSFLDVPYPDMSDSDATPPSTPPPVSAVPPRSVTPTGRPSTVPSAVPTSISGRPIRSNRSVLPSRFKEFQHVDDNGQEGDDEDGEYEDEDDEFPDHPEDFDDFDNNHAISKDVDDLGMRGRSVRPWDEEPELTPPPAAQPAVNLFPSDDDDVHPVVSKAAKGRARVPASNEEEHELTPTPRVEEEEDDGRPSQPTLNKGKGRASLDDDDDDDDLGIHDDDGAPLLGLPRSLPAFNTDLLRAQKYTDAQIQEFRTLYDAMISTCTAVGKNIQTILRALGLTIAFSKSINAFNIFEAWLKWQPDTPNCKPFFFNLSTC